MTTAQRDLIERLASRLSAEFDIHIDDATHEVRSYRPDGDDDYDMIAERIGRKIDQGEIDQVFLVPTNI